jgi:hypothetical protein
MASPSAPISMGSGHLHEHRCRCQLVSRLLCCRPPPAAVTLKLGWRTVIRQAVLQISRHPLVNHYVTVIAHCMYMQARASGAAMEWYRVVLGSPSSKQQEPEQDCNRQSGRCCGTDEGSRTAVCCSVIKVNSRLSVQAVTQCQVQHLGAEQCRTSQ